MLINTAEAGNDSHGYRFNGRIKPAVKAAESVINLKYNGLLGRGSLHFKDAIIED